MGLVTIERRIKSNSLLDDLAKPRLTELGFNTSEILDSIGI